MRPTTKTRKSPRAQLAEVVAALDLRGKFKTVTGGMACNGALEVVAKEVVAEHLPPQIREDFEEFGHCTGCEMVYWAGSHYDRLCELIAAL